LITKYLNILNRSREQEAMLPSRSLDFAELFKTHYPIVYRYVRYRIDDNLTAEDLTAEIFERAYRFRHTYEPTRGAFSTWVGQIAQNWVTNYFKSHHYRTMQNRVEEEALDQFAGHEPSPEAQVIGGEMLRQLRECLERLNERDREIVTLRFGMNTGNKQIADMLNLKEHSVSVMLMRALDRLRGCQEGA
jgi:RNA polymerase sigma factor (sigma-70 family)